MFFTIPGAMASICPSFINSTPWLTLPGCTQNTSISNLKPATVVYLQCQYILWRVHGITWGACMSLTSMKLHSFCMQCRHNYEVKKKCGSLKHIWVRWQLCIFKSNLELAITDVWEHSENDGYLLWSWPNTELLNLPGILNRNLSPTALSCRSLWTIILAIT